MQMRQTSNVSHELCWGFHGIGTEKVSILETVCIRVSTRSTGFAAKEDAAIAKKQNLERVIHGRQGASAQFIKSNFSFSSACFTVVPRYMRRIVTITAESRLAAVFSFFRLKMDSATIVDVSDLLSTFLVSSITIVDTIGSILWTEPGGGVEKR